MKNRKRLLKTVGLLTAATVMTVSFNAENVLAYSTGEEAAIAVSEEDPYENVTKINLKDMFNQNQEDYYVYFYMVQCPFCNQDNTRVVDSRPADDNCSIRRRRLCDACGKRFTTYEKVETIPLTVIKKDQTREQYDRNKMEAGVVRACYKRAISVQKINAVIDEIETEIFNREEKEIESKEIGEIVMDKLKNLDAVAYVRFASVYREFKDVNTFMDELKKILE